MPLCSAIHISYALYDDERDGKQGRGRPHKQYLVQCKPFWVDGGRLTATGLPADWREKKASKYRC